MSFPSQKVLDFAKANLSKIPKPDYRHSQGKRRFSGDHHPAAVKIDKFIDTVVHI